MIRLGTLARNILFLFSLLVLGFLGGAVIHKDRVVSSPELRSVTSKVGKENATTERVFRDIDLEEIFDLGVDDGIYQPEVVRIDSAGSIYILDYGDASVKKFSPAGLLVWTYSPGKGEAPGQFLTPTDISVDLDGRVWVADPGTRRLMAISEQGALESSTTLELGPYRIARVTESGAVVMWPPPTKALFGLIGSDGSTLREFGLFLENQVRDGLVLDGWVTSDLDGGFLYGSMYLGLVARFDADSNLLFLTSALGEIDPPKVLSNGKGEIRFAGAARYYLRSISADKADFHLQLDSSATEDNTPIIDTFSLADGKYLHSWVMPEGTDLALVQEEFLVTVSAGALTKWRIKRDRGDLPG